MVELAICVFYDADKGKDLLLTAEGRALHFRKPHLKFYAKDVVPQERWIMEVDYHVTVLNGEERVSVGSIDLPAQSDAEDEYDDLLKVFEENKATRDAERFTKRMGSSVNRF